MLSYKGFQTIEELHHGTLSTLYRAKRESDQRPVVLKCLHKSATVEEVARFKHEFNVIYGKDLPGVVNMLSLEELDNSWVIAMESDDKSQALQTLLPTLNLDLADKLAIAVQCAEGLHQIHQHGIIHKDIKPENLIYNPESGLVKIIDFGISTTLQEELQGFAPVNSLEGSLPYIAPEQTGRMNRSVDTRTDLYSLGITFYELFAGHRPFDAEDNIGWVHCHIAKIPPKLSDENKDIPISLSNIIFKLLAKHAEARYQTAYGLRCDLEHCLAELQNNGRIPDFEIAQKDHSNQLKIPQKLYGREREITQLLTTFSNATKGSTELLTVAGHSGIGKSALIQEVHKPMIERNALFVSGKFDQYKRDEPFFALLHAMDSLVQQWLLLPENDLLKYREALLTKLEGQGRVLTDVLPNLTNILGEQPEAVKLQGQQSEGRLKELFTRLLSVAATKDHPLVIFLDDMQWADISSLNILHHILSSGKIPYLMLICAYRDNEVDEQHPFMQTLNELPESKHVNSIRICPLSVENTRQLLSDTFLCGESAVGELSQDIFAKTEGNPFFISETLKALHSKSIIHFDLETQAWAWNDDEVKLAQIDDNVVGLMLEKINNLGEKTKHIITLASCLGAEFSVHQLATIAEQPLNVVCKALWPAISAGLIIPLNHDVMLMSESDNSRTEPATVKQSDCRFSHDRIQQAAYALIDSEVLACTHVKIGNLLLSMYHENEIEENLFYIVSQLNHGTGLIKTETERKILREFNARAARKAHNAAAFSAALTYIQNAIELLEPSCWTQDYKATLALYSLASETAFLNKNEAALEKYSSTVIQYAQSLQDKIPVYVSRIKNLEQQGKPVEANKLGLHVLSDLGQEVPLAPTKLFMLKTFVPTLFLLKRYAKIEIDKHKTMCDTKVLAKSSIIESLASTAGISHPNLLASLSLIIAGMTAKYGNTSNSPIGLVGVGVGLILKFKKIKLGLTIAEISLNLAQQDAYRDKLSNTLAVYGGAAQRIKDPYSDCISTLREAEKIGRVTGQEHFAYGAHYIRAIYLFFNGSSLDELKEDMLKFKDNQNRKNKTRHLVIGLILQFFECFSQNAPDGGQLTGNYINENDFFNWNQEKNQSLYNAYLFIFKIITNYHYGVPHKSLDILEIQKPIIESAWTYLVYDYYHFYSALTYIQIAQKSKNKSKYVNLAKSHCKYLKRFVDFSPDNFKLKVVLIEAEIARISEQYDKARAYYEKAITCATTANNRHELALTCELTGKFYNQLGSSITAVAYISKAIYLYGEWKADAKVKYLQNTYRGLLKESFSTPEANVLSNDALTCTTTNRTTAQTTTHNNALDMSSVIKASQAISGEIYLESLLKTMMHIVIENAGADYGILIEKRKDRLVLQALVDQIDDRFIVMQESTVTDSEVCPLTLIQLSIRSGEPLIINDAASDTRYSENRYIQASKPASLITFPIVNQGKTLGCIYLENRQVPEAFTNHHIRLLQMLASQAAVSMSNALLYQNLEKRVAERTQQLQQKTQDINNMLQNMHQGILTITDDLTIHGEYSRHLENILETTTIAETKAIETLFGNSDIGVDVRDQISAAIFANFGVDRFLWEMNAHIFIRSYTLKTSTGKTKAIEIDWDPLVDAEGVIEKILVTVRDVTSFKALQAEADSRKNELEMLGHILALTPDSFTQFIQTTQEYIRDCIARLDANKSFSNSVLNDIYRKVHTIKGNARTLGFKSVTDSMHELEQAIENQKSASEAERNSLIIISLLHLCREYVNRYERLYKDKLSNFAQYANSSKVESQLLDDLYQAADAENINAIKKKINDLRLISLTNCFSDITRSLPSLAKELDKPEPKLHLKTDDVKLTPEMATKLNDVFVHIIRNSIDHGLEAPGKRVDAGKTAEGNIYIECELNEDGYCLTIWDDGQGLAMARLREMIGDKSTEDAQRVADTIFKPGFSTAEKVTDISGRGVGMSAVKTFLQENGGDININLKGTEHLGFQPFQFAITLPAPTRPKS